MIAKWWEVLYCKLLGKKQTFIDKGCKGGDYTCEMECYKLGDKIIVTNYSLYKEIE